MYLFQEQINLNPSEHSYSATPLAHKVKAGDPLRLVLKAIGLEPNFREKVYGPHPWYQAKERPGVVFFSLFAF